MAMSLVCSFLHHRVYLARNTYAASHAKTVTTQKNKSALKHLQPTTVSIKFKQVGVQLLTPADNVALLAATWLLLAAGPFPCSNRSISPGHRAHSSKPAAACGGRKGQTDNKRQTDGRTDARQMHRPCCAHICGHYQWYMYQN